MLVNISYPHCYGLRLVCICICLLPDLCSLLCPLRSAARDACGYCGIAKSRVHAVATITVHILVHILRVSELWSSCAPISHVSLAHSNIAADTPLRESFDFLIHFTTACSDETPLYTRQVFRNTHNSQLISEISGWAIQSYTIT